MLTLCKKMHMDSCMRAYSTVQQLLCHGGYCDLILSLARILCRLLSTASPTARPLPGNPLRDVVRSRNPSKSTLAHDAVANAVLHKHHPRKQLPITSTPGSSPPERPGPDNITGKPWSDATCPCYAASSILSCLFQQKERDKAEASTLRGSTVARCARP